VALPSSSPNPKEREQSLLIFRLDPNSLVLYFEFNVSRRSLHSKANPLPPSLSELNRIPNNVDQDLLQPFLVASNWNVESVLRDIYFPLDPPLIEVNLEERVDPGECF
jgi:hypothetical protein